MRSQGWGARSRSYTTSTGCTGIPVDCALLGIHGGEFRVQVLRIIWNAGLWVIWNAEWCKGCASFGMQGGVGAVHHLECRVV